MARDHHSDALLSHGESLRRLARGLVGEDGAADLVQEAYTAALRSRAPIRRLSGFLSTVVRRRAVDNLRRRAEEPTAADEPLSPSTDDSVARLELVQVMVEELRSLPPSQRDAIELRYFDDLTPAEIGRRLGVEPATVRAHLSRGLESLRERLDRRVGERREWLAALVPWAASSSPPLLLALLMNTKFLALASIVIAVAGVALWSSDRTDPSVEETLASRTVKDDEASAETERATVVAPEGTGARQAESSLVPEPARSVLTGRVVDERTAEPVPALRLLILPGESSQDPPEFEALRASGELLELTTDEFGAFTSTERWAPGPIRIWSLDDHWDAAPLPVQGRLEHPLEQPLEVAVGPTFRLDPGELPPEVHARLYVTFEGPGLQAAKEELDHFSGSDPSWVRFSPRVPTLTGVGPWTLTAIDPEGFYRGQAVVTRRQGIEPSVIHLDGELVGVVEIDWTPMAEESAQPNMASLEGSDEPRLAPFGFAPDVNLVQFAFVPPGTYRWSAGDHGGDVLVRRGETSRVLVEPDPDRPTFSISVTFDTSRAPEADLRRCELVALPNGDFRAGREGRPVREGEAWVAAFEGLSPAEWQLQPQNSVHNDFRIEPQVVHVTPESPHAHFQVLPRGAVEYCTLELTDRATGEPIAGCMVEWQDAPGERQIVTTSKEGVARRELELGQPSVLVVHATGYRSEVVAFTPTEEQRTVRVALDPGWRSLVRVVRLPMEMVEGVEVFADGRSLGRTGELGFVYVDGEGPPKELNLGEDGPAVQFTNWGQIQAGPDPHGGWMFLIE